MNLKDLMYHVGHSKIKITVNFLYAGLQWDR